MRIFSVILPVRVSGLIFSEFLLTFGCYLAVSFITFRSDINLFLFVDSGLVRLFLVSASVSLGIFVNNLYADTRSSSRILLSLKLCNVFGIALIVQGLLSYISSGFGMPRLVMIGSSAVALLVLLLWRILYVGVFLRMIGTQNILFIGRDTVMEEIAARIHDHPELGFRVIGYLDSSEGDQDHSRSPLGERLGLTTDLEEVVRRWKPNRIVVGMTDRRRTLPIPPLLQISRRGVIVEESSTAYERVCGRVCSRQLNPSQIIFRNELATRPGSMALQSIYTNLVALSSIIVTSPLMLLAAIAVKVSSRGPILEPDVRVGQNGIPFSLHRFRCHREASAGVSETLDGRLTPVGKVLRKLGIHHLPTLFNLVRGEITFVGPRPERPEFVEELSRYFAFYQQRHSVKPGMTGWSQINAATPKRRADSLLKLEYDLYYTKHISLALDAYIILHGIRSMLPFAHR
jgi:lipopolysaccharide/colanic/teichoic acid biosynthesis glycosyltransferase